MISVTSWTFRDDEGQAVLLPPEVAYGSDIELTIVRSGDVLTIYPTRTPGLDQADPVGLPGKGLDPS